MALKGRQWPLPASATIQGLMSWAQRMQTLLMQGFARDFYTGNVRLTAGTTTTLSDNNLTPTSNVHFTPANGAARTLGIPAVTAKAMRSFTLTTASATGTETYDYTIFVIPAA